MILLIPAVVMGGLIAWRTCRLPVIYHSVTVTPLVSESQQVSLLELKAGGDVVAIREEALDSDWTILDDAFIATPFSRPLTLSFKKPVNTHLALLFSTSPQGGSVVISYGMQRAERNLQSQSGNQVLATFATTYRGLPNWLFIPALWVIDFLTFSAVLLAVFLVQAIGEKVPVNLRRSHPPFFSHRTSLIVLVTLSVILHLLNALSVPLILDADSPVYLEGAAHLVEYGNLEGIPMARGPGTTFLFAPVILLAGRNPWGMKVLLHILGVACVPLAYRLGWQLGQKRWIAFVVGLITALLPDLFIYSNFVMADLPNIFLVLLFSTFLLSALEAPRFRWIVAAMLTASYATLIRSENILLLVISGLFLGAVPAYRLVLSAFRKNIADRKKPAREFLAVVLSLLVAILPLLWWSARNYRLHGFFGLSNYSGAVLYDGWIFLGDAKGFALSDPASPAVQELQSIRRQYPPVITDPSGVATSTETFSSLVKAGYSTWQAYELLQTAAWDSIIRDWDLTLRFLTYKLGRALAPVTTHLLTFPLPGEEVEEHPYKALYFDRESLSIPAIITAQRAIYGAMQKVYPTAYQYWVWIGVFAMFFGLYRSPTDRWLALVVIAATRIFIPPVISVPYWRYTLAGVVLLQVIAVSWIAGLLQGGRALLLEKHSPDGKPSGRTIRVGSMEG